ncbi:MAG: transglycosylase domain-containing protein [Synechococcaceae cyanobacterium]|nr:transglycosylase domain-containing protein [Synechococcaceae cyanobacterium]
MPGHCYRLGREPQADIVIDHPAVSRRHALLERHDDHWLLSDNGSTNGLWWNGRRVRQLVLLDGDRIRLGPASEANPPELLFERQPSAPLLRLLRPLSLGLTVAAAAGVLLLTLAVQQLPIRGNLASVRGPLVLYDRQQRPVASASDGQHRELARLSSFSPRLIDALLASEDSRFWWHPGVDPIGTARALVMNLLGGRVLEGGSTLTQQLARSLYPEQVGQGETLGRKWRELLVALQLEARFSKHDLLLSYLNRVYLGIGWGFEDAARRYFGRPASALQLEEAALLVGLLPSPNGFDPCIAPTAALDSRNRVLAKMVDDGRLSPDLARAARRRPIQLAPQACRGSLRRGAPYYTDQVRQDLAALVGDSVAAEGNFLVETHLDPVLQQHVEQRLRQWLLLHRDAGASEGAVVLLDSRSGGILAIAGGRDYQRSQFNRASQALRQPGSTFKLFTYLAAVERGRRPGDPIGCGPLVWQGQQFSSGCGGSLSLAQALAASSNTAALRLGRQVGLDSVIRKARDLGIRSPLDPVPGLILGQSELTLLELTGAYGAIANDGIWHEPTTIRQLTDAETCQPSDAGGPPPRRGGPGRPRLCRGAEPRRALAGRQVVSKATARTLQTMLRRVVEGGTGSAAWVAGGAYGKTGTTNDGRDLLFVGALPSRHWVMGIWLGNDDNRPTRASSALAAGLWADILRSAPQP